MKKILGLFCVFCLCGMTTFQGMAVVKSGRCDIHRADKKALPDIIGGAIGGGIGWATGGAIGASLAPFTLIGRGMVDPVVGTLRINGTILVSSVGGAVVGGIWGARVASKIYSGEDYLCFDDDKLFKCLQCDVHQIGDAYECGDTHVVIGPKFAKRCNASRNPFVKDVWEDFTVRECSSNKVIKSGVTSVNIKTSSWKDLTNQGAPGWLVVNRDACYEIDCDTDHGWYYDSASQTCKERKVDPNPNPDPTPDPERKTCRERRVNMGTDAIACCDTGKEADWTGGQCVCKDKSKEFRIVNGRGKCVAKDVPGQKTCREQHATEGTRRMACCDVEDAGTGYWENGDCYCNDKKAEFKVNNFIGQCIAPSVQPTKDCPSDAHPSSDNKTCVCNDDKNMEYDGSKCICKDRNKEVKDGKCEYSEAYIAILISGLDSKYDTLSTTIGGFEKNVWRDADGNFNTARLASDSIAGVVLGTVGGIVTANLVKKAQVKQGFEDIGCYIGGQSVADYGDEFNVGR